LAPIKRDISEEPSDHSTADGYSQLQGTDRYRYSYRKADAG
jgi:hypothetical protein